MSVLRVLLRGRAPSGGRPGPTADAACQAPFGSLFLDPLGDVYPCCVSSGPPLGNVGRQRLPEIWQGARLEAVRSAMQRHDYELGCQVCRRRLDVGMSSVAVHYEHLAPDVLPPAHPRKIELNLSNACNLRCVMCNGDYSSAIRVQEGRAPLPKVYDDRFFADLHEFLVRVEEVQFTGGEPFLVPEYPRIWDDLAEHNPGVRCYLTTNATQWNARVERALRRLRFNLNVSIDGASAATYEAVRQGADHATVLRNLERFVAYTREVGTRLEIYHCLMPQNHEEFGEVLLLGDRLEVDVHVSRVEWPSHCSLEGLADPRPVMASFDRLAEQVRPRLGRNAAVFDEQHRRVQALSVVGTVVGFPRRADDGASDRAGTGPGDGDKRPAAWVLVGADERIEAVSPAFTALTGIEPGRLTGRVVDDLDAVLAGELGDRGEVAVTAAGGDVVHQQVTYGATALHTILVAERDDEGYCEGVRIHVSRPD